MVVKQTSPYAIADDLQVWSRELHDQRDAMHRHDQGLKYPELYARNVMHTACENRMLRTLTFELRCTP